MFFRLLFVIWTNTVRVYSTSTGEWLRDLEGFNENIVGLEFDLYNPKVLVGCSSSGEVISWKWRSGYIHARGQIKIATGSNIGNFHLISLDGTKSHGLIAWSSPTGQTYTQLCYIDLETYEVDNRWKVHGLSLNKMPVQIAVGVQAFKFFAVIQGTKIYHVKMETGETTRIQSKETGKMANLTLVKCHPTTEAIMTGSNDGKLFFWSKVGGDQCICSLFHWHSQAVATVAFTETGSGFYSGGLEAVVVKWDLDRPEIREFMPRLSGAVHHLAVAPGNQKFAVATEDNAIRIYSPNKQQLSVIQHFTRLNYDATGRQNFPVGLRINPRTSSLVLNGREGYLQFFSTHTRNLLYNIEILQENRLMPEREKLLFNTRVTRAAITMDWMVTAECWDDRKSTAITRMRFWAFNQRRQGYELNTSVEMPHLRTVTSLEFSSMYSDDNLLCASSGGDNLIKVWMAADADSIYRKGVVWYCTAKTHFKNMPVYSLCFSQDGSVLAAGCGNTLCVWNAENLKLKCALSAPQAMDGNANKVVFELSENIRPGNGKTPKMKKQQELVCKTLVDQRKKIIDSLKELLQSKDTKFINLVQKEDIKPRYKQVSVRSLNIKEKELLFKKIRSLTELTLRQKFELFAYLRIGCRTTVEAKSKLSEMLNARSKLDQSYELRVAAVIKELSEKEKFVLKNKFGAYKARKRIFYKNKPTILPYTSIFNITKTTAGGLKTNGNELGDKEVKNGDVEMEIDSENEVDRDSAGCLPPIKRLSQIKHVLFGSAEFSYLITVCTENRVLVWNLLTLRLQTSIKLSVDNISIDPYTNLLAAFTTSNERMFLYLLFLFFLLIFEM